MYGGFPETIHVDNGADFRAEAIKEAGLVHGINIEFRPVGRSNFGGHIERVIGTNISAKSLEELTEEKLKQHLQEFCKYCGNFKAYKCNSGNFLPRSEKAPFKAIISNTWELLYADFKSK